MTTEEIYRQRVNRVTGYIREHLAEPIEMEHLAALSAYSMFHFHRIMRAYLGEPIGSYLTRVRLETAARLLRYEHWSIMEIADKVGYDSPSSFSKAFHKAYGISPTIYRKTKHYEIMKPLEQEKTPIKLSRVKLVEQEAKQVLYITKKGNYSDVDFGAIFERFWKEVKQQGLHSAGIEHLVVYYNSPEVTEAENLRYDICLHVVKPAKPSGNIGVKEIGGGKFARFLYTGPYQQLNLAYEKIYGELLAKNHLEPRDNYCYEKYISDARRIAPEKLKTEIFIPVV